MSVTSVTRVSPKKLILHPDAKAVPEMPDEQFQDFLDSVMEHGVRKALEVIPGTTVVVDGRTRLKAALKAGLHDVPIIDATITKDESPELYMINCALERRQLTTSQRAMLIARKATLKKGNPNFTSSNGNGTCESNASKEAFERPNAPRGAFGKGQEALDQKEAADKAGVGRRTVQRAKTVLEKGTEEEIEAVDKGEVPLTRAEIIIRQKEEDIRKAAKADPERFGDLIEKLNNKVAVDRVHRELRKREKEGTVKKNVLNDALDEPVPDHLRDLFGARWLTQLAEMTESLVREGVTTIKKKVDDTGDRFRWLLKGQILKALESAKIDLEAVYDQLNAAKPHCVCPKCEGSSSASNDAPACRTCGSSGYLPKWKYAELKKEGKL